MQESGTVRHVFASGAPRSGTTLLQLVLSAHPRITIAPETRLIGWLFRLRRSPHRPLSAEDRALLQHWVRKDQQLTSWPGAVAEDVDRMLVDGADWTVASFLDQLFQLYARRTGGGTAWLGNKREIYLAGYTGYTLRAFPDAHFIAIVRDPRDVVRSIVRNLRTQEVDAAATVCHVMGRHIVAARKRYPDRVHVVRYEDLVRDPDTVCRAICSFLGEPFDAGMITFHEGNRDGARLIGDTRHIHPHTTTPFNPDLIGQWEKESCFSQKELHAIESATRDMLLQFGYEPATDARSGSVRARMQRAWTYHRQRVGRLFPRPPVDEAIIRRQDAGPDERRSGN